MGNICLCDQFCARCVFLQHILHEFDKLMCFRQMHTGCSKLFPHKPNGIQPYKFCPCLCVHDQNIENLRKHIGTFKIQVDLVFTEGCPYMLFPLLCVKGRQKRKCSWPGHCAVIRIWITGDKIISVRCLAFQITAEPFTAFGYMVDHRVKHQPVIFR